MKKLFLLSLLLLIVLSLFYAENQKLKHELKSLDAQIKQTNKQLMDAHKLSNDLSNDLEKANREVESYKWIFEHNHILMTGPK